NTRIYQTFVGGSATRLNFVKGLAMANVRDIEPMLRWNETHHIRFLRLSSDMFPFMSHAELGYPIDFAETELRRIGQLANTLGHRLTFHPGQFNQLGSPSAKVIDNSLWELDQHAQILDFMHMPADSVMIIHMGGMYGSKSDTLERFAANFRRLSPSAQARLLLENDEICYSVADLMPLCERLSIPLVLDWHHDDINPSPEPPESYLPAIRAIWERRGIRPKQHYSEGRRGAVTMMERRAHSDRVVSLPPCEPDVDLMIEAKDKEQAVFQLYEIYGLHPVDPTVVRPPAAEETTQTKGRKSSKSKAKPGDIPQSDHTDKTKQLPANTETIATKGSRAKEVGAKRISMRLGTKQNSSPAALKKRRQSDNAISPSDPPAKSSKDELQTTGKPNGKLGSGTSLKSATGPRRSTRTKRQIV
ncbi:hypothetical protein H4R33_006710, partial [Dimargaris cristalligena]